jgi:hypothetical protein
MMHKIFSLLLQELTKAGKIDPAGATPYEDHTTE